MALILVRTIIEMLGAPKEHIDETLRSYISKLREEGLNIKKEHYANPEKAGSLFTVFAELEVQFSSPKELLDFCFDSLPSSVEIIDPSQIELPAQSFTDLLNDLQARLHEIDSLLKNATAEKQLLDKNALNVLRNFIKHLVKSGPRSSEELSIPVGMSVADITPILDRMVTQNLLKKENGLYLL